MCERFYFPYARKLWGLEPEEISGEQARRRLSADSPAKLERRSVYRIWPLALPDYGGPTVRSVVLHWAWVVLIVLALAVFGRLFRSRRRTVVLAGAK